MPLKAKISLRYESSCTLPLPSLGNGDIEMSGDPDIIAETWYNLYEKKDSFEETFPKEMDPTTSSVITAGLPQQ
ncbi:hypothetical protein ACWA2B_05970 [Paenibacillus sp. CMM36]|jgi:hypothetical protein